MRTAVAVAAGAGICFLGYCVYFDRKRRSDPNFRKRLVEKRRKQRDEASHGRLGNTKMPDLKDTEAVQQFFMQEIQHGELLLTTGDVDGAVEHLSNAIAVCAQPAHLLQVLQQTLPPEIFARLMNALPTVQKRVDQMRKEQIMGTLRTGLSQGQGGITTATVKELDAAMAESTEFEKISSVGDVIMTEDDLE